MIMKRALLIILMARFFIGCNQDIKDENARLKEENLELRTDRDEFNKSLTSYMEAQEAIKANLDSIRAKEDAIQAIRNGDFDGGQGEKEQILADIAAIDALLAENRQTIANLSDKIYRYSVENGKFKRQNSFLKKQIAGLESDIALKDSAIVTLKDELVSKNFKIEELNTNLNQVKNVNKEQSALIAQQTSELNTAYYAVGAYSDLKANNVVKKEGGIIGLGTTKKLADDFNKEYFTRIDITKTKIIPVDSEKKVELITEHPSDSYKWNMVDDKTLNLEVLDSDKFWKSSKYLVIMTK